MRDFSIPPHTVMPNKKAEAGYTGFGSSCMGGFAPRLRFAYSLAPLAGAAALAALRFAACLRMGLCMGLCIGL